MRWFFSYVQVYRDGRFQFGCTTAVPDEHPIATVRRWNEQHGTNDGYQAVLLSFQKIGEECPDVDILSQGIS